MTWPVYPEESKIPPTPRISLKYGLGAWLWIEIAHKGRAEGEVARELSSMWFSLPWPSERIALLAFILAVVWLVGGGVMRRPIGA